MSTDTQNISALRSFNHSNRFVALKEFGSGDNKTQYLSTIKLSFFGRLLRFLTATSFFNKRYKIDPAKISDYLLSNPQLISNIEYKATRDDLLAKVKLLIVKDQRESFQKLFDESIAKTDETKVQPTSGLSALDHLNVVISLLKRKKYDEAVLAVQHFSKKVVDPKLFFVPFDDDEKNAAKTKQLTKAHKTEIVNRIAKAAKEKWALELLCELRKNQALWDQLKKALPQPFSAASSLAEEFELIKFGVLGALNDKFPGRMQRQNVKKIFERTSRLLKNTTKEGDIAKCYDEGIKNSATAVINLFSKATIHIVNGNQEAYSDLFLEKENEQALKTRS